MNKDYDLCEANGTKFLFVQAFVSDSVVKLNEQLPDDTDNECVERLAKSAGSRFDPVSAIRSIQKTLIFPVCLI